MTAPTLTVRHTETAVSVERMCSPTAERVGLDVDASITYEAGQTREALEAVDRISADLRRQIADAAERSARP